MRKAPSRRITSPLSIGFCSTCWTSAANSPRCAEGRAGRGTAAPRQRASDGRPARSGVSNRPGAMVTTRMALSARSRAADRVSEATPPLLAAYAAWPICPSKAAIEAGHDDAAVPGERLVAGHRGGGLTQDIERTDQVDVDDAPELLERQNAATAPRCGRESPPRDRSPRRAAAHGGMRAATASLTWSASAGRRPRRKAGRARRGLLRPADLRSPGRSSSTMARPALV